jgi:hypothetical protein
LKAGGQYSVKDFGLCMADHAPNSEITGNYGEFDMLARVVVMQEDYIEKALHCSQRI